MPGGTFAVFSLYIWAAKVQRWNTCLLGVTSATPAMHIYICCKVCKDAKVGFFFVSAGSWARFGDDLCNSCNGYIGCKGCKGSKVEYFFFLRWKVPATSCAVSGSSGTVAWVTSMWRRLLAPAQVCFRLRGHG